jgi:UPF0148 protein
MDEDEVLTRITRLLEQGYTMLATHHDCGAPLFRCQGEIVCPVCSFGDLPDSQAKARPSGLSERREEEKSDPGRAHLPSKVEKADLLAGSVAGQTGPSGKEDLELLSAMVNLRASLLCRLKDIASALEGEQDLDKVKKQLDCLEGLLRVLRSLQE